MCVCALYMLQNACKSEAKSAEPHWLVLQVKAMANTESETRFFQGGRGDDVQSLVWSWQLPMNR